MRRKKAGRCCFRSSLRNNSNGCVGFYDMSEEKVIKSMVRLLKSQLYAHAFENATKTWKWIDLSCTSISSSRKK